MDGRVMLQCGECGRTREVHGEIPDEYIGSFALAVREDGWVPRPGREGMICRDCLPRYAGHETLDDEEKVQGLKDPLE